MISVFLFLCLNYNYLTTEDRIFLQKTDEQLKIMKQLTEEGIKRI